MPFAALYLLGGVLVAAGGASLVWFLVNDAPKVRRVEPGEPGPTPASSHREAKAHIEAAWAKLFPGEAISPGALQILAGIGVLEGGYGKGAYVNKVTGEKRVINNWGAIQGNVVDPATGRVGGFVASDYNPKTGQAYERHYQIYATPADGAYALVRLVEKYAPEALRDGHVLRVSKQMYTGENRFPGKNLVDTMGYYQGTVRPKSSAPSDVETAAWANIDVHSKKLFAEAAAFARANDLPLEAYLEDIDAYRRPEAA